MSTQQFGGPGSGRHAGSSSEVRPVNNENHKGLTDNGWKHTGNKEEKGKTVSVYEKASLPGHQIVVHESGRTRSVFPSKASEPIVTYLDVKGNLTQLSRAAQVKLEFSDGRVAYSNIQGGYASVLQFGGPGSGRHAVGKIVSMTTPATGIKPVMAKIKSVNADNFYRAQLMTGNRKGEEVIVHHNNINTKV